MLPTLGSLIASLKKGPQFKEKESSESSDNKTKKKNKDE